MADFVSALILSQPAALGADATHHGGSKVMKHVVGIFVLLLTMSAGSVSAAPPGPKSVRDRAEASMLVTGEIDIEPDGTVSAYRLDQPEKLVAAVTELLGKNIQAWRFVPVVIDGRAVRARTRTSIRLVARKAGEGNYSVSIVGARFGSSGKSDDTPTKNQMLPPKYPKVLARAGVGGAVYLVLKVARDGTVENVLAEQVNLRVVANDHQMKRMRDQFAKAAVNKARSWTFNPPAKLGDEPYWSVRVPVDFVAPGTRKPEYGEWHAYIPGERTPIPWSTEDDSASPDTLVAGGVYPVGKSGPELLTPLESPES